MHKPQYKNFGILKLFKYFKFLVRYTTWRSRIESGPPPLIIEPSRTVYTKTGDDFEPGYKKKMNDLAKKRKTYSYNELSHFVNDRRVKLWKPVTCEDQSEMRHFIPILEEIKIK